MSNKFENLPEGRETLRNETLSDVLHSLSEAQVQAYDREIEFYANNPAQATEIAQKHPLYASFLVLHGTRRMQELRTTTSRSMMILKTRPSLKEAAAIGRGLQALRSGLENLQRNERMTAGVDQQGVDANMLLFRGIVSGPLTGPGTSTLPTMSEDMTMTLRYAALGMTKTPEYRMREYLDRAVLPIPEAAGNTYKPYNANDPALIRSADVVNLLLRTQKHWKEANNDKEFSKLLGKDFVPNQSVWTATQTIRDRDKPHTPVGKHFDRSLLSAD